MCKCPCSATTQSRCCRNEPGVNGQRRICAAGSHPERSGRLQHIKLAGHIRGGGVGEVETNFAVKPVGGQPCPVGQWQVEVRGVQSNTVSVDCLNRRSAPVSGAARTKQKTRWNQGKGFWVFNLLRLGQPRSRYRVQSHPVHGGEEAIGPCGRALFAGGRLANSPLNK